MFAGQVIVGPCVSFTVTVKVHCGPAVVVQVTIVVPTGKNDPDAGLHATVPKLPPAPRMSWNAAPPIEISSTPPSKVDSVSKLFRKFNRADAVAMAITGEFSRLSRMLLGSVEKASFGAVSGLVVEVTHGGAPV